MSNMTLPVADDLAVHSTALLVQLLLSIHRRDVAQTIYQNAKSFGEDSLLMQIMEAWIGMKTVGRASPDCEP
jgi:hypothetical protein